VIVCNVRGRSETTNKSDRIDADGLSEMLRVGSVKSVYHGASGMQTLKELVRCYVNKNRAGASRSPACRQR